MLKFSDKVKLKLFKNIKGKDGLTTAERMLQNAARFGDLDMLRYLKDKGVPETVGNWNALDYADFKTFRLMTAMGYGNDMSKEDRKKAILASVMRDKYAFEDPGAISFCRGQGISMGLKDKDGNNLLLKGKSPKSVQNWVAGAHITQVTAEFVAAAARNDVEMLETLHKSGKVVPDSRIDGKTAAFQAISRGQAKAALWLLQNGARMNEPDAQNRSAFATEQGKVLGPQLLAAAIQYNLTPAARELLNADISVGDPQLVQMAADNHNQEVLTLLHKKGASFDTARTEYASRFDRMKRSDYSDQKDVERTRSMLALLNRYGGNES